MTAEKKALAKQQEKERAYAVLNYGGDKHLSTDPDAFHIHYRRYINGEPYDSKVLLRGFYQQMTMQAYLSAHMPEGAYNYLMDIFGNLMVALSSNEYLDASHWETIFGFPLPKRGNRGLSDDELRQQAMIAKDFQSLREAKVSYEDARAQIAAKYVIGEKLVEAIATKFDVSNRRKNLTE